MLGIFRSNQPIVGILLIVYLLILHLPAFWGTAPAFSEPAGLLSAWMWPWLTANAWWARVIPIGLVFLTGLLANTIIYNYRLSPVPAQFAGVFVALVGSAIPDFLGLHPMQFANIFLMLAVLELFAIYRQTGAADRIFNAGLFIGLASLLSAPYLGFLLLGIVANSILRATKIRENLMFLVGAVVPHFLGMVAMLWFDRWPEYLQWQWGNSLGWIGFQYPSLLQIPILYAILFILLVLWVVFTYGSNQAKAIVEVRKRIDLFYWMLLVAVLVLCLVFAPKAADFQVLVLPIGILLSFSFVRMNNQVAEALHLVLLAVVLYFQFLPLILSQLG